MSGENVAHLELDHYGPPAFRPDGGELLTFGILSHAWRWSIAPGPAGTPRVGPARRVVLPRLVAPSLLTPTSKCFSFRIARTVRHKPFQLWMAMTSL